MNMNKEQDEAIKWAEDCIEGHRRGKGELKILSMLLDIINELASEVQLLSGGKK